MQQLLAFASDYWWGLRLIIAEAILPSNLTIVWPWSGEHRAGAAEIRGKGRTYIEER